MTVRMRCHPDDEYRSSMQPQKGIGVTARFPGPYKRESFDEHSVRPVQDVALLVQQIPFAAATVVVQAAVSDRQYRLDRGRFGY